MADEGIQASEGDLVSTKGPLPTPRGSSGWFPSEAPGERGRLTGRRRTNRSPGRLSGLTRSTLSLEGSALPARQVGDIEVLRFTATLRPAQGEEEARGARKSSAQGKQEQRHVEPAPPRRHGY